MDSKKHTYFSELGIVLQQEGFVVERTADGYLDISLEDKPLCKVKSLCGILYREEDISTPERETAKDRAYKIVRTVSEYMDQLEQAPPLKAVGLKDSFKLLADFNGTVLAAQESKHGVQFVTWDWSPDRTGLNHGHYYQGNYLGAKQDFVARSGLVDKHRILSDVQLSEVYRCVHETLESHYPMTAEREKLLKAVVEQIEYGVPNLDELVEQSNLKEMEVESSVSYQGMIQQF